MFVPYKNIHHNILNVHEILSIFSKNCSKGGYMAIKLDMEKLMIDFIGTLLINVLMILVFERNGLTGSCNA